MRFFKNNFIKKIKNTPKKIFLVDALGALLTTLILLIIYALSIKNLKPSIDYFHTLPIISFLLFIYSINCYFFIKHEWKNFLKFIIIGNTFYVLFSLSFVLINLKKLDSLILIYFMLEIVIIALLVLFERKLYRIKLKV
jgi:hypothetical protein